MLDPSPAKILPARQPGKIYVVGAVDFVGVADLTLRECMTPPWGKSFQLVSWVIFVVEVVEVVGGGCRRPCWLCVG